MTMSMYSSITPDEFHGGADEDVFGEYIIQYSILNSFHSWLNIIDQNLNIQSFYTLYMKSTQFSKSNATGVRENMKWQAGL